MHVRLLLFVTILSVHYQGIEELLSIYFIERLVQCTMDQIYHWYVSYVSRNINGVFHTRQNTKESAPHRRDH